MFLEDAKTSVNFPQKPPQDFEHTVGSPNIGRTSQSTLINFPLNHLRLIPFSGLNNFGLLFSRPIDAVSGIRLHHFEVIRSRVKAAAQCLRIIEARLNEALGSVASGEFVSRCDWLQRVKLVKV